MGAICCHISEGEALRSETAEEEESERELREREAAFSASLLASSFKFDQEIIRAADERLQSLTLGTPRVSFCVGRDFAEQVKLRSSLSTYTDTNSKAKFHEFYLEHKLFFTAEAFFLFQANITSAIALKLDRNLVNFSIIDQWNKGRHLLSVVRARTKYLTSERLRDMIYVTVIGRNTEQQLVLAFSGLESTPLAKMDKYRRLLAKRVQPLSVGLGGVTCDTSLLKSFSRISFERWQANAWKNSAFSDAIIDHCDNTLMQLSHFLLIAEPRLLRWLPNDKHPAQIILENLQLLLNHRELSSLLGICRSVIISRIIQIKTEWSLFSLPEPMGTLRSALSSASQLEADEMAEQMKRAQMIELIHKISLSPSLCRQKTAKSFENGIQSTALTSKQVSQTETGLQVPLIDISPLWEEKGMSDAVFNQIKFDQLKKETKLIQRKTSENSMKGPPGFNRRPITIFTAELMSLTSTDDFLRTKADRLVSSPDEQAISQSSLCDAPSIELQECLEKKTTKENER